MTLQELARDLEHTMRRSTAIRSGWPRDRRRDQVSALRESMAAARRPRWPRCAKLGLNSMCWTRPRSTFAGSLRERNRCELARRTRGEALEAEAEGFKKLATEVEAFFPTLDSRGVGSSLTFNRRTGFQRPVRNAWSSVWH